MRLTKREENWHGVGTPTTVEIFDDGSHRVMGPETSMRWEYFDKENEKIDSGSSFARVMRRASRECYAPFDQIDLRAQR